MIAGTEAAPGRSCNKEDLMNSNRLVQLVLFSAFVLFVAACGGGSDVATQTPEPDLVGETQAVAVDGGSYTNVSVKGLVSELTSKDFALVNVHIPYAGELQDTDAFIPFDQIAANLSELPADKDAQIVLYCRSGAMSAVSAAELVQQGYTNVWNLDGGMIAWEADGEPLLQNGS